MTRVLILPTLICILLLTACAAMSPDVASQRPQASRVILVSIDGFRADYLDRGFAPNLSKLAAQGARGEMRPSFPSKTFPNHYTLVTGLRPDRNGIVDNNMEDPQIPGVRFSMSNAQAVRDARWWDDGVPLWVSAERAGVISATMFWPGSEAPVGGVRPTHWRAFDQAVPASARVDQVLAWLDLPPDRSPRLVAVYFDDVDTAGHNFGPDSAELNAAVAKVDAQIGRLSEGLAARGLAADMVVVADHGMATVTDARVIVLEDLVAPEAGRAMATGAFLSFVPAPGRESLAEAALLKTHPHMACWRKADIPARFHYGSHRRVPPIFCLPETGWEIVTRGSLARRKVVGGAHGFDPFSPEMAAIFVAAGPDIAEGVRLPAFDNVDVYPFLARLARVRPEPNDGDDRRLTRALAVKPAPRLQ